jgi:hypothetical protein
MAHFAKINEDNKVLQVLTLNNSDMQLMLMKSRRRNNRTKIFRKTQ